MEWLNQHQMGLEAHPSRDVLPQPRLKKNFDERAFLLLSLAVHNALEERLAGMPADQHAAVHKSHGKTLFGEGRLAEAERELAEATSLAPSDSEAHLSLAEILEAEEQAPGGRGGISDGAQASGQLCRPPRSGSGISCPEPPRAGSPGGRSGPETQPG